MSVTGQMTYSYPPKMCETCGDPFFKPAKYTVDQWERKQFCSNACRAKTLRRSCKNKGRWWVWVGDSKQLRAHAVMEEKLGRRLRAGEVVHHINGDPTDDRLENLQLFASNVEHMAHHWAEGTIKRLPGKGGSFTDFTSPQADWPS